MSIRSMYWMTCDSCRFSRRISVRRWRSSEPVKSLRLLLRIRSSCVRKKELMSNWFGATFCALHFWWNRFISEMSCCRVKRRITSASER